MGTPPADTIQAGPKVLVSVILQDPAGRPLANQEVRFQSSGSEQGRIAFVWFEDPDDDERNPSIDTTDADGKTRVLVSRGTAAGTAWLRVRAPALGIADSLQFVIQAGHPADILLSPADTAVRVDGTFTLQGRAVDRFSNARSDAVTFDAESTAVSLSGNTAPVTVTGMVYGRASVLATVAGVQRHAWMSVVPNGTLAFSLDPSFVTADSMGIATASTDGANYKTLFESRFDILNYIHSLDWAPDGQSLVFHQGSTTTNRLYRITLDGAIQRVITQNIGGFDEVFPRYGPDGWIYFTAQIDWSIGTDELWRVRPDGSSPQRIGPPAAPYQSDYYPAPAPDGVRVWFATDRPAGGPVPVTLAELRLDTGAVTYLGFYGLGPVWSPAGDRIAFVDGSGSIIITDPDGSNRRVVSNGMRTYSPYIDWSPDGHWIVASGSGIGVDLIEPDLGITLPLAFAIRGRNPAWRP